MHSCFILENMFVLQNVCSQKHVHNAPLKGENPFLPRLFKWSPVQSLSRGQRRRRAFFLFYGTIKHILPPPLSPLFGKTEWEFEGIRGGLFQKRDFFSAVMDGYSGYTHVNMLAKHVQSKLCALILNRCLQVYQRRTTEWPLLPSRGATSAKTTTTTRNT